jgi:hypothetical protein
MMRLNARTADIPEVMIKYYYANNGDNIIAPRVQYIKHAAAAAHSFIRPKGVIISRPTTSTFFLCT